MDSSSALNNLLLNNSTDQFYIEYGGYLVNHMSHGIVALARMGADTERIETFVRWYLPRLEEKDMHHNDDDDDVKVIDYDGLLGARKSYYALVDDYKTQLNEKFGGSLENLIADNFPKLFPGLLGSALHGIIHLGYAYAARQSQLVCEGLAYMHYSYTPLKLASVPLTVGDIGKGPCSIADVLETISKDRELIDTTRTISKSDEYAQLCIGGFPRRVKYLFDHRSDDLLRYAYRIQIPGIEEMEDEDPEKQRSMLLRWLLDSAVTVYALIDKHDLFLLHGVTAAWSLLQLQSPVVIGASRHLTLELVATFVCALLAAYVSQGAPRLCPERLCSEEDVQKETSSWTSLLDRTLAEDRDEHIYKLVQVVYELSEETDDQQMQNLYLTAALRALDEPFKF